MAQPNKHPQPAMPDAKTSVLELRGGTDAAMAPPVGYIQHVMLPMLQHLQQTSIHLDLQRRGFFPRVNSCATSA